LATLRLVDPITIQMPLEPKQARNNAPAIQNGMSARYQAAVGISTVTATPITTETETCQIRFSCAQSTSRL
jgi:hypothetical protein